MGFFPARPIRNMFTRVVIAEMIGTFFLVFAITCSASQNLPSFPRTPFSAGFTLMTQVFTYGYISGGMFNPAVTTGVMLVKAKRGELSSGRAAFEWGVLVLSQILAGTIGSLCGFAMNHGTSLGIAFSPVRENDGSVTGSAYGKAWFGEFLWTFLLVSSVLGTAVAKAHPPGGNHFFGLTIGMSVFAGAMTVGQWSGGAFNPAVSFGYQLAQCIAGDGCTGLQYFWLYFVSCFPAGCVAALSFSFISCEDTDDEVSEADRLVKIA